MHEGIQDAHHELVQAVAHAKRPGHDPIPISIVSVNDGPEGQMIVFDESRYPAAEVAKRLEAAAAFVRKSIGI